MPRHPFHIVRLCLAPAVMLAAMTPAAYAGQHETMRRDLRLSPGETLQLPVETRADSNWEVIMRMNTDGNREHATSTVSISLGTATGDTLTTTVQWSNTDPSRDTLFDRRVAHVIVTLGDSIVADRILDRGVNLHDGHNALSIARRVDAVYIHFGTVAMQYIGTLADGTLAPTSIAVSADRTLAIPYLYTSADIPDVATEPVYPAPESLTAAGVPADYHEGVWEYFDRVNDPDNVRPGGRYRLAVVRSGTISGGYDMIYLGGAAVCRDLWQPGMVKGRLHPTLLLDVYDLQWYDATGNLLDDEASAVYDPNHAFIRLTFPEHHAEMRLSRMTR